MNTAYFVKPSVTRLGASSWIFSYEASRPNASSTSPGTGNGYYSACATPADPTCAPNNTPACSVPNRIPWFNVTPLEVTQTCQAMGGTICDLSSQWQAACEATIPCKWGFNPRGAACTSVATASKLCNIGPTYDVNPNTTGDQDGLLPTASPNLQNCWADWLGIPAVAPNAASTAKIFDMTGNLREITITVVTVNGQPTTTYPLMGGSFVTSSEEGARCDFSFFNVDESFKFFDTGFRCCFTQDPTL
jgi:hypothetical protein